ncbi:MAG: hypothetical protein Q8L26_08245 [Candidatus Omnitrophota bacterium]|nr:hypothetical protein [Candidatus Omnitrophota bacterium]
MPKANVYLIIGDNEILKLNKIESLKKEILSGTANEFNLEILFAEELNLKTLEEALLRLPIKTDRRMLILRNLEDLSKDCRQKIIAYVNKPHPWITLVLEGDITDKEAGQVAACAQIFRFSKVRPPDVFALGRAIDNKNQALALGILSDLMVRGERPQKIMGGLIWHWENTKRRLSPEKIKEGFEVLLEADLNIKLSRLKPNIALELLVVKLCLF